MITQYSNIYYRSTEVFAHADWIFFKGKQKDQTGIPTAVETHVLVSLGGSHVPEVRCRASNTGLLRNSFSHNNNLAMLNYYHPISLLVQLELPQVEHEAGCQGCLGMGLLMTS